MEAIPKEITAALLAVSRSTGYVQKDGYNGFGKYKYATEAAICAQTRGALAEAGLQIVPEIEALETGSRENKQGAPIQWAKIRMLYHVCHAESGRSASFAWAGYAEDSGDKAEWKAITGAKKYFLANLFLLVTGDDPESEPPAPRDERRNGNGQERNGNDPERNGAVPKPVSGSVELKINGRRVSPELTAKFWRFVDEMPGIARPDGLAVLRETGGEARPTFERLREMSARSVGWDFRRPLTKENDMEIMRLGKVPEGVAA